MSSSFEMGRALRCACGARVLEREYLVHLATTCPVARSDGSKQEFYCSPCGRYEPCAGCGGHRSAESRQLSDSEAARVEEIMRRRGFWDDDGQHKRSPTGLA